MSSPHTVKVNREILIEELKLKVNEFEDLAVDGFRRDLLDTNLFIEIALRCRQARELLDP